MYQERMVITFTKLTDDDLSFLNEVRNLVAFEFLHDSRTFSLDQTREWFRENRPDYWVIRLRSQRIGYFRLANHCRHNRNLYVGADLHPDFQGQGYARIAYQKFLPFVFKEYDLHKVSLEVLSNNSRAISLYRKLGFVHEGTKRQEVLKGSSFIDSHVMSMLRSELNFLTSESAGT